MLCRVPCVSIQKHDTIVMEKVEREREGVRGPPQSHLGIGFGMAYVQSSPISPPYAHTHILSGIIRR